jgi:hypothetical protein
MANPIDALQAALETAAKDGSTAILIVGPGGLEAEVVYLAQSKVELLLTPRADDRGPGKIEGTTPGYAMQLARKILGAIARLRT